MDTILYFQSQSKTNAAEKLGGVQDVAAKCGWLVQTVPGLPSPKRLRALEDFWRPVGAIVECGGTAATVAPSMFGDLPIVFLDHDPSCLPKNAFCVTHDSAATARMAARELMRSGATAFAYVPYPERRFWSDERERGFVSALSLNGRACRVFSGRVSASDPTRYQRGLRAFVSELPKPCALFAANDAVASEVLSAAIFAGVKVPDDLAVIGVDDAHDICEHTTPTLSSVKPDFRRGGELAALLLAARRVLGRFPCSRRQAEMRFRKATGHSVLDEIHDVQLARAKDLLREGTMPLKAISDFCGFENPNSLRKFFKARTGRTMSEWRSGNLS